MSGGGKGAVNSSDVIGTQTNDSAAAGKLGEYIESVIASGSAVSLTTTATARNLTSISLTAGDWDVTVAAFLLNTASAGGAPVGMGLIATGPSTVSVVLPNEQDRGSMIGNPSAVVDQSMPSPVVRISLSATTTVYFIGYATWTSGTPPKVYGRISARRVR